MGTNSEINIDTYKRDQGSGGCVAIRLWRVNNELSYLGCSITLILQSEDTHFNQTCVDSVFNIDNDEYGDPWLFLQEEDKVDIHIFGDPALTICDVDDKPLKCDQSDKYFCWIKVMVNTKVLLFCINVR